MRICLCCMLLVFSAGIASGQDTTFSSGPQYQLNPQMKNGPSFFARPISTPSMSLAGPPLQVGASNATGSLIAGAGNQNVSPPTADDLPQLDLIPVYYGAPLAGVIEISFDSESTNNPMPASILDTGVSQITTATALRERGYGLTLAEGAAYGKAQTRRANRVYTNADIDRLHSGS